MTALVRHVKIPCRYVSGYLYPLANHPDRSPEGAPSDAPPPPETELNAPPQWEPVAEVEQFDVQQQQQQQQ